MTRVPRKSGDLHQALIEQVSLLVDCCESYDDGKFHFAKPMSSCLRVLLHHGQGSSQALLHQLKLRSGRFFSIASPPNARNVLSECNLIITRITNGTATFLPNMSPLGGVKRMPFPEWWVRPIVKGRGNQMMSRMDIVKAVADMDGGAHLDPALTPIYEEFRSGRLLGWMIMTDVAPDGQYIHSPQYACIRAIAHEVLLTLEKYAQWSFAKPYRHPADDWI